MFIKKIGYLLLVRLKLFHLLAKLSPLFMLFSLVMMFFILGLKEEYKFQEPSLKTKIFDIADKIPSWQLNYQQVFEGIKVLSVQGALDNQCILVTFPANNQQSPQIKGIYHTLLNQKHNSKNAVLLSYQNQTQLDLFFQWYFNPALNHKISFGVIRVGVNIDIKAENSPEEEAKDKAYLKLYSSTLHPDLDYFQACKELLQKLNIVWSPCQQIHKSPLLKSIKNILAAVEELILKEKQLRLFYDHVLCELSEHLSYEKSAHEIMMLNGFQAGTIKFTIVSKQPKVEKFIVSFINEFGMQQDHLHSANTFYYPISKAYFAPMMLALYPSLLFFTALALYLFKQYFNEIYKEELKFSYKVTLLAYVMITEYSLTEDYSYSCCMAVGIFGWSIVEDVILISKGKAEEYRTFQLGLIAIQGLVSIYFGVFCLSLSYIAILAALLMLLKPRVITFKLPVKLAITTFISLQFISFSPLLSQLATATPQLKLCLMIPILFYSL